MLTDKALKNVQACLASCDELIYGKFIFAENIISKILQNISESNEIYELIAECMQNFNFDREFNRARVKLPTKDGYFIMPESKEIVLPLVFCILVDIRDKKINLHEFIKNYFNSEEINEFENFAQTLILPFRNAIAYCFGMDKEKAYKNEQNEQVENIESKDEQIDNIEEQQEQIKSEQNEIYNHSKVDNFTKNVSLILNQIQEQVDLDKKLKDCLKNDIKYLIDAMLVCIEKLDIQNLSAYIVAFDYVVKPVKSVKFLAHELKQNLICFYS